MMTNADIAGGAIWIPIRRGRRSQPSDPLKFMKTTSREAKSESLPLPRANLTAFMHYATYVFGYIKPGNPEINVTEVKTAVKRGWNGMKTHERAYWDEKAAADKERYQRELAKYQNFAANVQDIVNAKMSQEALDELWETIDTTKSK
jgi:hypothetical protein